MHLSLSSGESGTSNSLSGGFNSILFRAVDTALVESLGDSAAKAVKFYIQVPMIAKDTGAFRAQLRRLFSGSEAGSKLIEDRIMKSLQTLLNQSRLDAGRGEWSSSSDLGPFIDECRNKFIIA